MTARRASGASGGSARAGRSASPPSMSDARLPPPDAQMHVGEHVLKYFKGHGNFTGKVVRVQNVPGFPFRVRYEDSDSEDMSMKEFLRVKRRYDIKDAKQKAAAAAAAAATAAVAAARGGGGVKPSSAPSPPSREGAPSASTGGGKGKAPPVGGGGGGARPSPPGRRAPLGGRPQSRLSAGSGLPAGAGAPVEPPPPHPRAGGSGSGSGDAAGRAPGLSASATSWSDLSSGGRDDDAAPPPMPAPAPAPRPAPAPAPPAAPSPPPPPAPARAAQPAAKRPPGPPAGVPAHGPRLPPKKKRKALPAQSGGSSVAEAGEGGSAASQAGLGAPAGGGAPLPPTAAPAAAAAPATKATARPGSMGGLRPLPPRPAGNGGGGVGRQKGGTPAGVSGAPRPAAAACPPPATAASALPAPGSAFVCDSLVWRWGDHPSTRPGGGREAAGATPLSTSPAGGGTSPERCVLLPGWVADDLPCIPTSVPGFSLGGPTADAVAAASATWTAQDARAGPALAAAVAAREKKWPKAVSVGGAPRPPRAGTPPPLLGPTGGRDVPCLPRLPARAARDGRGVKPPTPRKWGAGPAKRHQAAAGGRPAAPPCGPRVPTAWPSCTSCKRTNMALGPACVCADCQALHYQPARPPSGAGGRL